MHTHSLEPWAHSHVFLGDRHDRHARRTWAVVALAAVTMVAEIAGGTWLGSMALVADGWHMSTHAAALGIAALAYHFARRHADDPRFSFGTGKFGDLAAFASALLLGLIALLIGAESLDRLLHPVAIGFGQAIPIAVLGLAVNLASVWLLHDDHDDHGHDDHAHHHGGHAHGGHAHAGHAHGGHGGHDTNFRAAYVHVLADTLTSVLAIAALLGGRYLGLAWLDPAMGLVGTAVILAWSWSLLRTAALVLLDARPSPAATREIRERLEIGGDRVSDLHLWQLGPGHRAAVIALVSDDPQPPAHYKARLAGVRGLSHVTVEVQPCVGHAAAA
ncbi:cation diffusion facilitator family transporter [Methylobacterium sp. 275MFSha3.1]|uniref:CDF family Co(II)/Ni(II) efflux transporter DmeF n=1 Tax=Methylobacterium sp. 275MFSha3.1 TaxID=1502746 RepID=UPI0008A7FD59|nr:CDF family Co(II)/Ni(II) efflux transporter DmeF [Methylobacterium sp. 275MFSha3.1]SEH67762.1 cation diffusion facilitator family transporter [Methylobacterium sp. 275MFSha3.1]